MANPKRRKTPRHILGIQMASIAFMSFPTLFGCSSQNGNEGEVKDPSITQALFNFSFKTRLINDGASRLPYYLLWDGYGNIPSSTPTTISKEERLHTYLLDFGGLEEEYYLVFMNEYRDFELSAKALLDTQRNPYSCWYCCNWYDKDYKTVIDGRLLSCGQLRSDLDLEPVYWSVRSLEDAPTAINGGKKGARFAVFCARRKRVTILEDLSTSQVINRQIDLYCRVPIKYRYPESGFEETIIPPPSGKLSYDAFEGMMGDEIKDYEGKMVMIDSADFPKKDALGIYDFLYRGLYCEVHPIDGVECIGLGTVLDRGHGDITDYLNDELDESEDIFRDHKEYLKSITESKGQANGWLYSYFRLDGMKKLIAECGAK